MTAAQKTLKKKLIQSIHLTPRWRNHFKDDREGYEAMLREHFGASSSTELSIDQLIVLLEYMKMRRDLEGITPEAASSAQLHQLRRLWKGYARDTSDTALIRFVGRYNGGVLPIRLEALPRRAAQKAIIALKKSSKEPA